MVDDVVRIAVEPWRTRSRRSSRRRARRPHAAKPSRAEISARKSRIVRRPEEDAAARTTSKRAREMGFGRSLTCVGIFADVLQPVPKVLDEEGESESRGRALLMARAACERENRPIANFLRLHTIGFFNLELFRDYRAVRCSSARPAAGAAFVPQQRPRGARPAPRASRRRRARSPPRDASPVRHVASSRRARGVRTSGRSLLPRALGGAEAVDRRPTRVVRGRRREARSRPTRRWTASHQVRAAPTPRPAAPVNYAARS